MNLIKLLIPKEGIQTVTELESWTIEWHVKSSWPDDTKRSAKVFIKEQDADEFRKQLKECANFINCWIDTKKIKN